MSDRCEARSGAWARHGRGGIGRAGAIGVYATAVPFAPEGIRRTAVAADGDVGCRGGVLLVPSRSRSEVGS